MKILHTTDLHFEKNWFHWIKSQEENFDLFCISGDFLDSSHDTNILEQIEWVSQWIKQFNKPLFVCSGNHEEFEKEDWLSDIDTPNYYPDNSIVTINDITFGCYPYIGADGYFVFDECDVLITHIPPANTKTSMNQCNNDWGDKELYKALKNKTINPKILLCGHMHVPLKTIDYLLNTTIYNPGVNQGNKIPNNHKINI